MKIKQYAGIGSRQLPDEIKQRIIEGAKIMANRGALLRTGGAEGSDEAFLLGAGIENTCIYLPWKEYNGHKGPQTIVATERMRMAAMEIASKHHPAWDRCSQGARKLHARNVQIILGCRLDNPVDIVVCYTENGEIRGGTAMGITIANLHNIPVRNLGDRK